MQQTIDIAMTCVPRVIANPHLCAQRLDAIQQFDQRKVGLEKVRLPAELGIARVLRLTKRMPGVVSPSPRRKLDRRTLADMSSAFGSISPAFNNVLPVHDNRRMTCQSDGGRFCAPDIYVKE